MITASTISSFGWIRKGYRKPMIIGAVGLQLPGDARKLLSNVRPRRYWDNLTWCLAC